VPPNSACTRRRLRGGERAAKLSAFTQSRQFKGAAARVMPIVGRMDDGACRAWRN
jgi:hypothetical protein